MLILVIILKYLQQQKSKDIQLRLCKLLGFDVFDCVSAFSHNFKMTSLLILNYYNFSKL